MLKNVEFDIDAGTLSMDGVVVAPLSRVQLIDLIDKGVFAFVDATRNPPYWAYGMEVTIQGQRFSMQLDYRGDEPDGVWLLWNEGIAGKKGYDTSEKELIADKNNLTKLIRNVAKKDPDVREYSHDAFTFHWGRFTSAAAIQSAMVSWGVEWRNQTD